MQDRRWISPFPHGFGVPDIEQEHVDRTDDIFMAGVPGTL